MGDESLLTTGQSFQYLYRSSIPNSKNREKGSVTSPFGRWTENDTDGQTE